MLDGYFDRTKNTSQPICYAKYAAIYFTYKEKYYIIYPSRVHASQEVFEMLEDKIIDDLYNLGAYDMHYSGMLD